MVACSAESRAERSDRWPRRAEAPSISYMEGASSYVHYSGRCRLRRGLTRRHNPVRWDARDTHDAAEAGGELTPPASVRLCAQETVMATALLLSSGVTSVIGAFQTGLTESVPVPSTPAGVPAGTRMVAV
jgi:hypothetical protein